MRLSNTPLSSIRTFRQRSMNYEVFRANQKRGVLEMKESSLCAHGDTGERELVIPLGFKNLDGKHAEVAEQIVNDLISACEFTINNYDKPSPQFKKSLQEISKLLWRCL